MTNEERQERKATIRALTRYHQEDFYGGFNPWIDAARTAIAEVRDEEREEREQRDPE